MSDWISVEDGLPPIATTDGRRVYVPVLSAAKNNRICTAIYCGHGKWDIDTGPWELDGNDAYLELESEITHWMHLPDGPHSKSANVPATPACPLNALYAT